MGQFTDFRSDDVPAQFRAVYCGAGAGSHHLSGSADSAGGGLLCPIRIGKVPAFHVGIDHSRRVLHFPGNSAYGMARKYR